MKTELLQLLRCPVTARRLVLEAPEDPSKTIESGWLTSEGGEHRYAIQ